MNIRVLESNRTRINTELQRVQSRCEVRLVDFDDIRRFTQNIEWHYIDAQRARTASEGHGYVLSLTPAAEAEILRNHRIF